MDGTTLQNLFSQGNPFLAQMGEQAFQADQAKKQADLASTIGVEKRAQEMQPLEMAHRQALTRQGNANAATVEDSLAAQAPASERMRVAMMEARKKMGDAAAAEEDQKMYRRGQYAQMALRNKGALPLEYLAQLPEEERAYFANQKAAITTANLVQAWHDSHPKTMEARAKEDAAYKRAIDVANIQKESRMQSSGNKGTSAPSKLSLEQYLTQLNAQLLNMPDGPEKQRVQAEADRTEVQILRKVVAGAQARQGGTVNAAETANTGKVVANPEYKPTPTPRTDSQWTPPAGWK